MSSQNEKKDASGKKSGSDRSGSETIRTTDTEAGGGESKDSESSVGTIEKAESITNKLKLLAHKERLDTLLEREDIDGAIRAIREAPKLLDSTDVLHATSIREFVEMSQGFFNIRDIFLALDLKERREKQNASKTLSRLVSEGVLARHPKFSGSFRRVEQGLDIMEWRNAPLTEVDIELPLGINDFARIYQGNILVFAGTPDAGKTAFFLDTIKRNMSINKVHLFNSEMSEQELRIRIEQHEDISPDEWSFNAYFRSGNFGDCIFPNDINIIDYLDLGDDIPALTRHLREIYEALDKGIALVGLQKPFGRDMGYGKELGMQLPRLYVSFEYRATNKMSRATIVKCKSRKTTENMIGKVLNYKLYNGWNFEPQGVWHYPEDEPTQRRVYS